MRFLNAHMRVIDQVKFAHDGRRLFAAGTNVPNLRHKPGNRGIYVWDLPRGLEPVGCLLSDSVIAGFIVNPVNGWLYVGTGYDHWQDEASSAYVAVHPTRGTVAELGLTGGNAFVFAVHPSGRWFVGAGFVVSRGNKVGWRHQRLIRWQHPASKEPVKEADLASLPGYYTEHLAIDPNHSKVISHEFPRGRPVNELVYELRVRDPATGEVSEAMPMPGRTIHQLVFSPDGAWLVVRCGPSLLIWNGHDLTEKPQKVKGDRSGHFTNIAFHPSNRYLAATSNDETVKLFDTSTWSCAKTFTWDIGKMRSIAFSPDGTLAAAGSDSGKVVVWDVDL